MYTYVKCLVVKCSCAHTVYIVYIGMDVYINICLCIQKMYAFGEHRCPDPYSNHATTQRIFLKCRCAAALRERRVD